MAERKNYGSQYWLRFAVNRAQAIIDRELRQAAEIASEEIEWLSPLARDHYREYHDEDFIKKFGITLNKIPLDKFWPKGGPWWDGLARTKSGKIFLIEAKAHIPELNTDESGASPKSLRQIAISLNETRMFLDANPIVDWTRTFYQYTNRIANLYLLRVLNDIDAYLINVYFLNEKKKKGSKRRDEWEGALTLLKTHLGVIGKKLDRYMKDLFIGVKELEAYAEPRMKGTIELAAGIGILRHDHTRDRERYEHLLPESQRTLRGATDNYADMERRLRSSLLCHVELASQ